MKLKAIALAAFVAGFFASSGFQLAGVRLLPEARADVAGMSTYQLEHDAAFRQAVMNVVEEECKTSVRFSSDMKNVQTWHYCNRGSRFAP